MPKEELSRHSDTEKPRSKFKIVPANSIDKGFIIIGNAALSRHAVSTLIESPDLQLVGQANIRAAAELAADQLPRTALILMDAADLNVALEITHNLKVQRDDMGIVTLTPPKLNYTLGAFRRGIKGIVFQDAEPSHVVSALTIVARGGFYFCPSAEKNFLASLSSESSGIPIMHESPENLLSPREFEVIALVAQGMTNKQIASQLVISESTASSHVHSILEKLGLNNRIKAAVYAERHFRNNSKDKDSKLH